MSKFADADRETDAVDEWSSIPALTEAALLDIGSFDDSDCLIGKFYPGQPLIISFNYLYQHNEIDFFKRIKKLETKLEGNFNRIILRDRHNAFYQRGVVGMGNSVYAVAAKLHRLIQAIRPSQVITIGQSAGAYAAIMFGLILRVNRVIAFGPISHLKSSWAKRDGDTRWLPYMEALDMHPPTDGCDDLIALAEAQIVRPNIHLIVGTKTASNVGNIVNLDDLYAHQFQALPGVSVSRFPEADHAVTRWLVENSMMDEILYQCFTDQVFQRTRPIDLRLTADKTFAFAVDTGSTLMDTSKPRREVACDAKPAAGNNDQNKDFLYASGVEMAKHVDALIVDIAEDTIQKILVAQGMSENEAQQTIATVFNSSKGIFRIGYKIKRSQG